MKKCLHLFVLFLPFCIAISSCEKEKDNTPPPANFPYPAEFVATLDTQQINLQNPAISYGENYSLWEQGNIRKRRVEYITQILFPVIQIDTFLYHPTLRITLGTSVYSDTNLADYNKFIEYFILAPQQFAGSTTTDTVTTHGFDVHYFDETTTLWSTENGSADQTGSYLQISDVMVVPDTEEGGYKLSYKGTMQCKLYNNNGEVKQLTVSNLVGAAHTYSFF